MLGSLSTLLLEPLSAVNFSANASSAASQRVLCVVFSFSLKCFFNFPFGFFLTYRLFGNMLFSFQLLDDSLGIFLSLISNLISLWTNNMNSVCDLCLYYQDFIYAWIVTSLDNCITHTFFEKRQRSCFLLLLTRAFYKNQLR